MLGIFATRLQFAASGVRIAVGCVPCVRHGAMFAALHTSPVDAALGVAMVGLLSTYDDAVVTAAMRALMIAAPRIPLVVLLLSLRLLGDCRPCCISTSLLSSRAF